MNVSGPVHVDAEVVSVKRVGALRHLILAAPGVAERFRPGTFVAVSLHDRTRLAPRSFWIHRANPVAARGGTFELVLGSGRTASWLAGLPVGARVRLTGPLGRPFALPREPVTTLLIGEGHSSAPLVPLAERLRERGCVVHVALAATDEGSLLGAVDLRRVARSVVVATGDGSIGHHGPVADLLPELLNRTGAEVVYGAGSTTTMHAVAVAAEAAGAWSQTALELPQPCGTGLCHGCPVPVAGEDGAPRTVRACHEGPVFRGDRVRWAVLG